MSLSTYRKSSDEIISSDEEVGGSTVRDSTSCNASEISGKSESVEALIAGEDYEVWESSEDDGPIVRTKRNFKQKITSYSENSGTDSCPANLSENSANSVIKFINTSPGMSRSKDDSGDDLFERRALSPRTRMSITGIRPHDLIDDESDVDDNREKLNPSRYQTGNCEEEKLLGCSSEESFICIEGQEHFNAKDENFTQDLTGSTADGEIIYSTVLSLYDDKTNKECSNSERACVFRASTNFNHSIANKFSSTVEFESSRQLELNNSNEIVDIYNSPANKSTIPPIEISSDSDCYPCLQTSTPTKKSTRSLQPKSVEIINFPTGCTSQIPATVKLVSQEFLEQELRKLCDLKSELVTCENIVNTLGAKLPDKGKRMSGKGERLRAEIADLAQYIATLKVENSYSKVPLQLMKVPTWRELSKAANSVQPKYTGKIGMANFITQKTLTIDRLKAIHGSLETCPELNVLADEPKHMKVSLMEHQRYALAWMYWREKQSPPGGILADDMGLGKTLTMISLILASKHRNEEFLLNNEISKNEDDDNSRIDRGGSTKGTVYYDGGTLVVCPASLIRQWESEVENRLKRNMLTVCVYHGNNREAKARNLAKYDMVVTTYNLVPREMKSQGSLFGINWERIILDEAHIVRNHKSQASEGVCSLRGKHRWALTGTPIQNKEMDLYALLKFLKCTPFDDLAHWKKWIDNKSAGGQQRLNTLMKSLMLRRTKLQLQENGTLTLPERSVELVEVSLEKDEMIVYQKIMLFSQSLFAQFLHQRAEKNNDFVYNLEGNKPTILQSKDPNGAYYKMHQKFARLDRKSEVKSHEILVLLLRLRQICCHPGLIDSMLEDDDNISNMEENHSDHSHHEINLLFHLNKLQIHHENNSEHLVSDSLNNSNEKAISKALSKALFKSNPVFDFKRPSSKMKKIIEILEKKILITGDKAIVVSQWTSVLNILKDHLAAKLISVVSLDGSVAVKLRNGIVNNFNDARSNERIMLLSLTAGGVGLNLVGANHLLLIDLHWNPQLEAQAQDRIYRVGQKKFVRVYKFMCKETVEERIKALQDHKLAIANGVLTGVKASEGSKLTIDDLKSLFGL